MHVFVCVCAVARWCKIKFKVNNRRSVLEKGTSRTALVGVDFSQRLVQCNAQGLHVVAELHSSLLIEKHVLLLTRWDDVW